MSGHPPLARGPCGSGRTDKAVDWGVEGPPFETACGQIEGKPQSVLRIGGMITGRLRLHPGHNIPRISTGGFRVRPFVREVLLSCNDAFQVLPGAS